LQNFKYRHKKYLLKSRPFSLCASSFSSSSSSSSFSITDNHNMFDCLTMCVSVREQGPHTCTSSVPPTNNSRQQISSSATKHRFKRQQIPSTVTPQVSAYIRCCVTVGSKNNSSFHHHHHHHRHHHHYHHHHFICSDIIK